MRRRVAPHPLAVDRLERALRDRGCPVCAELARSTARYLRGVLREHKSAEGVWERLRQTWGLCREHTRGLLAEETRSVPGFSTATLYGWLAQALLHDVRRRPAAVRGLVKRDGECLACEQLGAHEQTVVRDLVRLLASGQPATIRETYLAGDGVCLPHLGAALDVADDRETSSLLTEHFLGRLRELVGELEAFREAATRDGSTPANAAPDPWVRAAERFAGKLGAW
jgi:hypothetical protein